MDNTCVISVQWNIGKPYKERSIGTCYNMDESLNLYAKQNNPIIKGHILYTLYNSIKWNIQKRQIQRHGKQSGCGLLETLT